MRRGMKFIVAIDGTAGSGKGTIGKEASKHFNFKYLDTGLLYRALALNLGELSFDLVSVSKIKIMDAINSIDQNILDTYAEELRKNEFGEKASLIAKDSFIREKLLKYQRDFANQIGGTILDGRDIGTVIFPKATYKIFLWAASDVRAKRRHKQLRKNGKNVSYSKIFNEINVRDRKDMTRKIAPLMPAANSVLLDTSYIDIEQVFNLSLIHI